MQQRPWSDKEDFFDDEDITDETNKKSKKKQQQIAAKNNNLNPSGDQLSSSKNKKKKDSSPTGHKVTNAEIRAGKLISHSKAHQKSTYLEIMSDGGDNMLLSKS